jgi:hypothetical protein
MQVTYSGPNGEITIVVEKMDASKSTCQRGARASKQIQVTKAETATFVLSSTMLAVKSMVVWRSNFGTEAQGTEHLFLRAPDVPILNGTVTLEVLPNWAYTISTVRSAAKGLARPPAAQAFPHKYENTFDDCPLASIPSMVAPMAGAFECINAGGGRNGRSVGQLSPAKAICDRGDVMPYAVLGDG